ncbi:MAG: D-xylose transporter subunit XylF [Pseudomonadota bacterium]|jgi:D-xylose transport system substrate-binding protein
MSVKSVLVAASLALSIIIGLVLRRDSGAASVTAGGAAKRIQIGLSLDTLKEARWGRDRDAFKKRAAELGADVVVLSANSDDNTQVKDVESLITSQVDLIVIVPHDGKAMAKAVGLAHAAGIPVISYDRLIADSDVDLYVTFDNRRVGALQAEYILEQLKDRSKEKPIRLVRIYGSKTDHNAFMFKEGQDSALEKAIASGLVQVVHEDWADDWKPENAKRIMNAALTKFERGIDAVLASNDGTAGGAIQALREEGIAGKVIVTGQDAELVACQRIVGGEQSMTIYKPVEQLARKATEVAIAMIKGKPVIASGVTDNGKIPVPSIFHDVVTVTRENLEQTVIADGFHPHDQVFKTAVPQ